MTDLKSNAILCWLATVDSNDQPSVSPKEVWTFKDKSTLIIANIASPNSIKNIQFNPLVGVSYIDIFVQKGKQLKGHATILKSRDSDFQESYELLFDIAGATYPFSSIISIDIKSEAIIVAPSYFLNPNEDVATKVIGAMNSYNVQPLDNK